MVADPTPQSGQDELGPPENGRNQGSPGPAPSALSRPQLAILLAVAAVAGAIGYRFIAGSPGYSEIAAGPIEKVQPLIRSGASVTVPEGSPVRSKLTVEAVAAKDIKRALVLPAVVEADPGRTVKVLPPVAGRVVSLKVQLGERVASGQELLVLDSGDLAQAFSDDEKAHTMLTLTKQALDRVLGLEKTGAAAVKEREQAQSDYAQAQSEFERAETRLRSIGVVPGQAEKTRQLTLKAAMAGSVIDLQVAPGDYLNDTTAATMTIANLETVWVTANVPESDMALVSKGQSVDVVFTAYPDAVFKGQVLFVSDVVDPDTRRTKVRIAFDNADTRLRPGMFAKVSFSAPAQSVAVVPTSALVLKDDLNQVFVETAPWTFEARTVDIGFQEGDRVALTAGVKTGERVVVRGGVLLSD